MCIYHVLCRVLYVIIISGVLAPGLRATATVLYVASDSLDQKCELIVNIGRNKVTIPCTATFPRASITVDTDIDFGVVIKGRAPVRTLDVVNNSKLPTDFSLTWDDNLTISMSPDHAHVEPGASVKVKVLDDGGGDIMLSVSWNSWRLI